MHYETLHGEGGGGGGAGLVTAIASGIGSTAGAVGSIVSSKNNYNATVINAKSQTELLDYQREKDQLLLSMSQNQNQNQKGGMDTKTLLTIAGIGVAGIAATQLL